MKPALPADNLPADICRLLCYLGLTPNYTGFFYCAYALHLVRQDPQRLCLIYKWLYLDVAKHYRTTPAAVERNIRLSIARIWHTQPERLSALSAVPLTRRPSNARFLSILYAHFAFSS